MRLGLCVAAALASGWALAAPTLESARAQVRGLKYAEAAKTLKDLERQPGLTRAEAAEYFLLDGVVRGSLKDAEGAQKSFTRALIIDPETKLPGRMAPRVSTPFAEAKAFARDHGPFELKLLSQQFGDDGWRLQFAPGRDELNLVSDVRFTIVEGGAPREVVVPLAKVGALRIASARASVTWSVLNAAGWVLGEGAPIQLEPPAAPAPTTPRSDPPVVTAQPAVTPASEAPSRAAPMVVLGVGAAALVGGGVFLGLAFDAAGRVERAETPGELASAVNSGKQSQTIGIALAAGGGAAAVAGIIWLVALPTAPVTVSVVPTSAGGMGVISGVFP